MSDDISYKDIKTKEKKVEADLTKERNDRCIPAAKDLLELSTKGGMTNSDNQAEMFKEYAPLTRDVMDIFMEHGVKLGEISYVFRLAVQPLSILQELTQQSIDKHVESTEKMFWDDKLLVDVQVKELDQKLKSAII